MLWKHKLAISKLGVEDNAFLCGGILICLCHGWSRKKRKPRNLHVVQIVAAGILIDVTKHVSFRIRFLTTRHTNKEEDSWMDIKPRVKANVFLKIIFGLRNPCVCFKSHIIFAIFLQWQKKINMLKIKDIISTDSYNDPVVEVKEEEGRWGELLLNQSNLFTKSFSAVYRSE